jgi:hypothetical protein
MSAAEQRQQETQGQGFGGLHIDGKLDFCHMLHGRSAGFSPLRMRRYRCRLDATLAESELGVLASQCLDRRIDDQKILAHQVSACQDYRNQRHAKANCNSQAPTPASS